MHYVKMWKGWSIIITFTTTMNIPTRLRKEQIFDSLCTSKNAHWQLGQSDAWMWISMPRLVYHCFNFCGNHSSHEVIFKNKKQKGENDQERDMPISIENFVQSQSFVYCTMTCNLNKISHSPEAKSLQVDVQWRWEQCVAW